MAIFVQQVIQVSVQRKHLDKERLVPKNSLVAGREGKSHVCLRDHVQPVQPVQPGTYSQKNNSNVLKQSINTRVSESSHRILPPNGVHPQIAIERSYRDSATTLM